VDAARIVITLGSIPIAVFSHSQSNANEFSLCVGGSAWSKVGLKCDNCLLVTELFLNFAT